MVNELTKIGEVYASSAPEYVGAAPVRVELFSEPLRFPVRAWPHPGWMFGPTALVRVEPRLRQLDLGWLGARTPWCEMGLAVFAVDLALGRPVTALASCC